MVLVVRPAEDLVAPDPAGPSVDNAVDLVAAVQRALIDMAMRSQRRQADLLAALRGAGLPTDHARVWPVLQVLYRRGYIGKFVPLSDGGLLLTVHREATEQRGMLPDWLPIKETDPATSEAVEPLAN